MDFHKISITDQNWINEYLHKSGCQGAEYSFATLMAWHNIYNTCVCEYEGMLCMRYLDRATGQYVYSFPVGNGDCKAAVNKLYHDAHENGTSLRVYGIEKPFLDWIRDSFAEKLLLEPDRNSWDYVYSRESLAELAGGAYQSKRNHIRRFMDNRNWHYERITNRNKQACWEMAVEWYEIARLKGNVQAVSEREVLQVVLNHYEDLHLTGGALYLDEEVVAFTIGEPLNDTTYHVLIEKAFADIQGAYPMINQQYVLHEMSKFQYVNREDDTGSENIRKAKESYHPAFYVEKWTATETSAADSRLQ